MALRYKISLLVTVAVLVILIPLSLIHIRALARAEEEEIQGRLRAIGKLMATELFTIELGAESRARQFIFLQAAQKIDTAILFATVYQDKSKMDIAVLSRKRFPKQLVGPNEVYPDHQVSLEHGDILAFYSDGILEAANPDDEMYGEERFHDALRRYAENTAQQIRDAILDEVNQFRGETPQDDDIALVIVNGG